MLANISDIFLVNNHWLLGILHCWEHPPIALVLNESTCSVRGLITGKTLWTFWVFFVWFIRSGLEQHPAIETVKLDLLLVSIFFCSVIKYLLCLMSFLFFSWSKFLFFSFAQLPPHISLQTMEDFMVINRNWRPQCRCPGPSLPISFCQHCVLKFLSTLLSLSSDLCPFLFKITRLHGIPF